jgi:hypothetical protein
MLPKTSCTFSFVHVVVKVLIMLVFSLCLMMIITTVCLAESFKVFFFIEVFSLTLMALGFTLVGM